MLLLLRQGYMQFKKKDFFSIPNILTYIRILLVPVFVLVYIHAESFGDHIWAAVIVVISGLTDIVDGHIARKYNMITDWGKIVDPIADKAMQFAMLFCVVLRYRLVWILVAVYAVKEIVSFAFSSYLFRHNKYISGANWAGKLCTVVLFIVMMALIVIPDVPESALIIMIVVASAFMLLAFAVYMSAYIKLLIELKKEQKELKE